MTLWQLIGRLLADPVTQATVVGLITMGMMQAIKAIWRPADEAKLQKMIAAGVTAVMASFLAQLAVAAYKLEAVDWSTFAANALLVWLAAMGWRSVAKKVVVGGATS